MERSFSQATSYGFKRSRWWRLWRVQIQKYLTAAIQNLKILLKDVKDPAPVLSMQVVKAVGVKASRTKPLRPESAICPAMARYRWNLSHPGQECGLPSSWDHRLSSNKTQSGRYETFTEDFDLKISIQATVRKDLTPIFFTFKKSLAGRQASYTELYTKKR